MKKMKKKKSEKEIEWEYNEKWREAEFQLIIQKREYPEWKPIP